MGSEMCIRDSTKRILTVILQFKRSAKSSFLLFRNPHLSSFKKSITALNIAATFHRIFCQESQLFIMNSFNVAASTLRAIRAMRPMTSATLWSDPNARDKLLTTGQMADSSSQGHQENPYPGEDFLHSPNHAFSMPQNTHHLQAKSISSLKFEMN